MLTWLSANLGTILTLIVLLIVVGLIIHVMIRDKKMGRTSCGNKCSHCAMAGKCHGGSAHAVK
ncbi:MAG: FeoB-associated Cys-rich membrane protein [Lachnospiraceae bacterium]|nr:FeoB-associated Cys-rich membrane protein [Lachnospiraceae bacterium]